ncbi:hypothetical protein BKG69_08485 [Mycobacteroides chelonae]|uniref:hypothetical protein n=1 Tax=Mycobacteroides chelonae TaxID=1774 RepID=UPI0008A839DC|nr:hypothetical protein [Mycobacteroides chelonae]OHT78560.1 hypothetical protein BKG69_08485 [Mycobacteroides chelonae]
MADNEPDHRDIEERKFELEEKKLNLEERKLHVETSFAKNYSAAIVSAFVTISVAIISFTQAYIAREDRLKADERTQLLATADQNRQVGQWGVSILELYFSHPDGFDPAKSPDTAQQNLTALAVSAPDIMKPILQQRQHDLVRMGAAGAVGTGETLSVVANALQAAMNTSSGSTPGVLPEQGALSWPPGWPDSVAPNTFTIYIQYGANAQSSAMELRDRLQASGFHVPGLDPVDEAPSEAQVRYYRPSQSAIAKVLAAGIGPNTQSRQVGEGDLPDGILEIWLPRS